MHSVYEQKLQKNQQLEDMKGTNKDLKTSQQNYSVLVAF